MSVDGKFKVEQVQHHVCLCVCVSVDGKYKVEQVQHYMCVCESVCLWLESIR